MNKAHELKEFRSLIIEHDIEKARGILEQFQPADIAELLKELDYDEQRWLVSLVDNETLALAINELDPEQGGELLGVLNEDRVSGILDEMSSDDAADLLSELPDLEQNRYLDLLEEDDQQDVRDLMTYEEDTAGGLMTTEYVAIREDLSAARAIEELRQIAPDAETVYYVYVINIDNKLVGVISLRELIIANPDDLIKNILWTNVISVPVDMDQEEVARIVTKYNFLAIPVIDHEGALLGIITVDDIIDVIHEEATEDLYRMAGTTDEEGEFGTGIATSLKSRLPWLLITLLGGFISGQVLSAFSDKISALVALSFFVPLLTGMGGNVGTQSSTVTVRAIAMGNISAGNVLKVIIRESLIGLSMGVIMGLIVGIVASLWLNMPMLGVCVALALMGNIFTAATMGTLIPIVFRKIGIDPAVASAPFISTTTDITGLIIYSSLVTLLMTYFL